MNIFAFKYRDYYQNHRKDILKDNFYLSNTLRYFLHRHCGKWICKYGIFLDLTGQTCLQRKEIKPLNIANFKQTVRQYGRQVVQSCLSSTFLTSTSVGVWVSWQAVSSGLEIRNHSRKTLFPLMIFLSSCLGIQELVTDGGFLSFQKPENK